MSLSNLTIQLRWAATHRHPNGIDLDLTCFLISATKTIPHEAYMVYHHNPLSKDGSVQHSGDDRTGKKGETLSLNLENVAPEIEEIIVVVTLYDAIAKGLCFADCNQANLLVQDNTQNNSLLAWDLSQRHPQDTAVEIIRFFRRMDGWRSESLGFGFQLTELNRFVDKYVP